MTGPSRTYRDSRIVPVFPLPNVVFFPETILPLHIFEPRYRRMVRDARRGDGLIAMALERPAAPGDSPERPAIHPIGTVGRIDQIQPLADGRFHLTLVGLTRVRFAEIDTDRPYRLAHAVPIPERDADEADDERLQRAKLDLLATHGVLLRELAGDASPGVVLDERIPFAAAVNGACANLPVEPAVRQGLLELDDLLERLQRVATLVQKALERVLKLKHTTDSGDPAPLLN